MEFSQISDIVFKEKTLTRPQIYDILNSLDRRTDFLCQQSPLVREERLTVFLSNRGKRAFYLGGNMKRKTCTKCNQEQPIIKFYKRKTGKNKGAYSCWCHKCALQFAKQRKKILRKQFPWYRTNERIKYRCKGKTSNNYPRYGGRGIKNLITMDELEKLWFRDKAYLMKKPVIHRLNHDGHYIMDNCKYVEQKEHMSYKRKPHSEETKRKISIANHKHFFCTLENCFSPHWGLGLCKKHYRQQRRRQLYEQSIKSK